MKRITITIPEPLLRAADERAKIAERSRSWIVVDALRRYLAPPGEGSGETGQTDDAASAGERASAAVVAERSSARYGSRRAAGLGPYRLSQLESDLRLSTEERVAEAELAARVVELRSSPVRHDRVLTFDRYEDFLEWERREELSR